MTWFKPAPAKGTTTAPPVPKPVSGTPFVVNRASPKASLPLRNTPPPITMPPSPWSATAGKTIAANVKNFHFHDHDLSDLFELYARLTMRTYSAKVAAGLNNGNGIDGAAKIASGADQLPNLGKDGMLLEFASTDAEGSRSSIGYAYHGFRPNLVTHLVLIAADGWKKGAKADECLTRLNIGITDLFYKLEHGYFEYSHARPETKPFTIDATGWDFIFTHSLWQDVLKPYHEGQSANGGGDISLFYE